MHKHAETEYDWAVLRTLFYPPDWCYIHSGLFTGVARPSPLNLCVSAREGVLRNVSWCGALNAVCSSGCVMGRQVWCLSKVRVHVYKVWSYFSMDDSYADKRRESAFCFPTCMLLRPRMCLIIHVEANACLCACESRCVLYLAPCAFLHPDVSQQGDWPNPDN